MFKIVVQYLNILLIYLILFNLVEIGVSDASKQLKSSMKENGIVPDIIDSPPSNKIEITFPSGVKVDSGNELTPLLVKDMPRLKWPTESGQRYTLVMIDPDAPTRESPTFGEVRHWIVINIPGNNLKRGQTLAPYVSSSPPDKSGFHRYIFLVYKQRAYLKHSETPITKIEDRMKFKVRDFANKYNLGQPVAANFYLAQADDYSRDVWAKSGMTIE